MPELREIEELIELMRRSGVSELSLELPDYKVKIKRSPEAEAPAAPAPAPQAAAQEREPQAGVTIVAEVTPVTSPVVGIFHNGGLDEPRRPLQPGDRVEEGQLLGVVEALKVPHEVRAPVAGTVAQVLVEDGAAVGYGDRLFLIQPARESADEGEVPIGLA